MRAAGRGSGIVNGAVGRDVDGEVLEVARHALPCLADLRGVHAGGSGDDGRASGPSAAGDRLAVEVEVDDAGGSRTAVQDRDFAGGDARHDRARRFAARTRDTAICGGVGRFRRGTDDVGEKPLARDRAVRSADDFPSEVLRRELEQGATAIRLPIEKEAVARGLAAHGGSDAHVVSVLPTPGDFEGEGAVGEERKVHHVARPRRVDRSEDAGLEHCFAEGQGLAAGVASAWCVGLGLDGRGEIRGEGRRVRRLPAGVGNCGRSRLRRVRTPRNHGREKQRGGQK